MAWKKGPLPPGTYNWGGVTVVGEDMGYGFYLADFKGNYCTILGMGKIPDRDLKPEEVDLYCNCLELPTQPKGTTMAGPVGNQREIKPNG